ncbi:uncharacterized protein L201_007096 [Kwoniella dendrophila CBS 6074]|uniref:Uncharacterized protein n=1 Tax=Kwoniella dendrophila CBS 6074 TaxID=1295534 RepID=A0AAX4K5L2_9TREE
MLIITSIFCTSIFRSILIFTSILVFLIPHPITAHSTRNFGTTVTDNGHKPILTIDKANLTTIKTFDQKPTTIATSHPQSQLPHISNSHPSQSQQQ